jgi:DNA-binding transcriptional LysR family regulator
MTPVRMEWESRLGRRLRVRDLYILTTVVRHGSMAKAARELAMSQPAVSGAIANLEHILGVTLLDRSPRGVEPTIFTDALLRRSNVIFDELKQSVRDVEFLADPTAGQLAIGSAESIAGAVLPRIVELFHQKYPRVVLSVEGVPSPSISSPGLRQRRYELILSRWHPVEVPVDDLAMEMLFEEPFVVAASPDSRWARRRKISLSELVDEPWILPPRGTWNYEVVAREFRAGNFGEPKVAMTTFISHLNTHLVRNGPYLTVHPQSWALYNKLAVLSVDVPRVPIPVAIVTLKDRSLSPMAERFAECAREATAILQKPRWPKPASVPMST